MLMLFDLPATTTILEGQTKVVLKLVQFMDIIVINF